MRSRSVPARETAIAAAAEAAQLAGAAVALLLGLVAEAGDGGDIVNAAHLVAGDVAAHINEVAAAHLDLSGREDRAAVPADVASGHLVLIGIVGKDHVSFGIGDDDGLVGALRRSEAQVHHGLIALTAALVGFGPVHGGAQSHHRAAVNIGAAVGIHAGIGIGIGHGDEGAAVDHQIAVGVDAVALATQTRQDVNAAAVEGDHRDSVLVDVDAVVLRENVDAAAVHRQVQLAAKALVAGGDIEHARAQRAAVDVHGYEGIEGAVHLTGFFLQSRAAVDAALAVLALILGFEHAVDVGAGEIVHRAVGDDHVCAGFRGVHGAAVFAPLFPGVVTFIDAVEHDGGGHGAGHVHAVQDHGDLGARVGKGVVRVAQIDPDLTVPFALDEIGARFGDVEHRVFIGLLFGMHHIRRDAVSRDRQGSENILLIALGGVVIGPFLIVVVPDLHEGAFVQLGIIINVMGDIDRRIGVGLGPGVVFRGAVFHLVMRLGGVGVPGVVIFRHRLPVQRGGVGIGAVGALRRAEHDHPGVFIGVGRDLGHSGHGLLHGLSGGLRGRSLRRFGPGACGAAAGGQAQDQARGQRQRGQGLHCLFHRYHPFSYGHMFVDAAFSCAAVCLRLIFIISPGLKKF